MSVRNTTIKSLTDVFPDDLPELTQKTSENTTGIFSFLSNVSFTTWLIIILILALLGINVFYYLAKGTETTATLFANIFGPIAKWFGYEIVDITKTTLEVSATGAQTALDVATGTTTGAVTGAISGAQKALSEPTGKIAEGSHKGLPVQDQIQQGGSKLGWDNDELGRSLMHAQSSSDEVTPDDALSSIQGVSGKSGWCFIGEQQGIRTCAELGVNDKCMSGDIFPSQAICMNPNLRA
jgi:hypothetical protein